MNYLLYFILYSTLSVIRSEFVDEYNILLNATNQLQEPYVNTADGIDFTAFSFSEHDLAIIDLDNLSLKDVVLTPPYILLTQFKKETDATSCLFEIVNENGEVELGLCFIPIGRNVTRLTLKSSSLPDSEVFFTISESINNQWTKVVFHVESSQVKYSMNCSQHQETAYDFVVTDVTFSRQSKLYLAHGHNKKNFFKGSIQDIKIYPNANDRTLHSICNDVPYLPDSTEEIIYNENFTDVEADLPPMGEKGEKGDKGSPGTTVMGPPGPEGLQGPPGVPGPKGDTGSCECSQSVLYDLIKKSPELKGERGPIGNLGPRGPVGAQGIKGDDGSDGKDGAPGEKGEPGLMGPPGLRGVPGPVGPPGSPGTCKEIEPAMNLVTLEPREGPRGEQGEKGEKGQRGIEGLKGEMGLIGPPGPPGEKGDTGPSGPSGAPGKHGLHGRNGERGEKGNQGDKGDMGPIGPPGQLSSILDEDMNPIEYAAILEKLRGPKGETGKPGENGEKGELGPVGVPGTPGKHGSPGKHGPMGPRGKSGPMGMKGNKGEIGPPGPAANISYSDLIVEKGNKGDRGEPGLPGSRGESGLDGLPGTPGNKGSKGDRGLTGSIGPAGEKGERGERGEKGENAMPFLMDQIKGEKGDRGLPGERGVPGVPGIDGKPAEPCSCRQENPQPKEKPYLQNFVEKSIFSVAELDEDDDQLYSVGSVICKTATTLFKKTSTTPLGTLAYVLREKILLLRVENGWQYVRIGSLIEPSQSSQYINPAPQKNSPAISRRPSVVQQPTFTVPSANTPPSTMMVPIIPPIPHMVPPTAPPIVPSSGPQTVPVKNDRVRFIRLIALNKPYSGKMNSYTNRTGRNAANFDCHREARKSGFTGTYVAFLSNRVENLPTLVKMRRSNIPVVNSRGDILFDSWMDIFNGNGGTFVKPLTNIYSFDRKNVLIDPNWPIKAVWHGGDTAGNRLSQSFCEEWETDSPLYHGVASSLYSNKLLGQEMYPCSSELIVLCVESVAHSRPRLRHPKSRPGFYSRYDNLIPGL